MYAAGTGGLPIFSLRENEHERADLFSEKTVGERDGHFNCPDLTKKISKTNRAVLVHHGLLHVPWFDMVFLIDRTT